MVFFLTEHRRSRLPALPAVVLQHIKGGVSEEGGASHCLVARILLRVTQLLHHSLTVPQQLIQPQLPAHQHIQRNIHSLSYLSGLRVYF